MADYAFRTMEDRLGIEKLWTSGKTPSMATAPESPEKIV